MGFVHRVTTNTPPLRTGTISIDVPCAQDHIAEPTSVTSGSFHRHTSIAKVRGEFHDPKWTRKRKKEPESTSGMNPMFRFNHAGDFNRSVNVFSLECNHS